MERYLLIVLWSFSACKSASREASPVQPSVQSVSTPFLKLDQIVPPQKVVDVDAEHLLERINSRSEFYASSPPSNETSDCSQAYNSKLIGVLSNEGLVFSGQFDVKSCTLNENGSTLNDAKIKSYVWFSCPRGDLSKLASLSLQQITQNGRALLLEACASANSFSEQSNVEVFGDFMLPLPDGSVLAKSAQVLTGIQGEDDGPCITRRMGETWVTENCSHFTLETVTSAKQQTASETVQKPELLHGNYFRRRDGRLLLGSLADRFYQSGTAAFQLNQWVGTISYSGTVKPPKWTAEKDKETSQGVFTGIDTKD